jgi:hypothetical protein
MQRFRKGKFAMGLPSRKLLSFLLGWSAACFFLVGCSKSASVAPALKIESELTPGAPRVGPVNLALRVTGADNRPVTGARIRVEADMSHPGMSPLFAEANEIQPGRYDAHLQFPMAGDWIVLLHLVLPNGQTFDRQVNVNGVRPN